ncbi:response regulator transcription factor [Pseudonocardia sp. NPDC049154]|uniref:response regulator transcription factor n=1 Tax=Pseudonocardia sp. NPDC049154 TaxID=3155501 RepID=UPI0033DCEDBD
MRVAVADDSGIFRSGLTTLLSIAGIDVTADEATGAALLREVESDCPDAVVLDIRMAPTFTDEGLATAEVLRRRYPDLGVLVLSTYSETAYAARLLAASSRSVGYLLKDRVADLQTLTDALTRIVAGECVVDPDIIVRLLEQHRVASKLGTFSGRERDILRLMAEGRSNSRIGTELFISTKTVEAHVAAVFSKLGLYPTSHDNRRVLAVLSWLRANGEISGSGTA